MRHVITLEIIRGFAIPNNPAIHLHHRYTYKQQACTPACIRQRACMRNILCRSRPARFGGRCLAPNPFRAARSLLHRRPDPSLFLRTSAHWLFRWLFGVTSKASSPAKSSFAITLSLCLYQMYVTILVTACSNAAGCMSSTPL